MLKRVKKKTNASRSQLVQNVRTGETAIYTPDARQPKIPSGWVAVNASRLQKTNSGRRKVPAEYAEYFESVSRADFADIVGSDVATIKDTVADVQDEFGKKVVGYIVTKDEYEDLMDNDILGGFVLEDGSVVDAYGEGYLPDADAIQEMIDEGMF